jgi:hypothetical protein
LELRAAAGVAEREVGGAGSVPIAMGIRSRRWSIRLEPAALNGNDCVLTHTWVYKVISEKKPRFFKATIFILAISCSHIVQN